MDDNNEYTPPWTPIFTMDGEVPCVLCHNKDVSVLAREADKVGICEPCAVIAHHLWKKAPGEVPPQFPDRMKEVSRVYVLLARLRNDAKEGEKQSPMNSAEYKFVVRQTEDGGVDLPGADVAPGEDLRAAAARAMGLVGVTTWPHSDFVEPLYTGYTPRAHLTTVMLVTAWHLVDVEAVKDNLDWRPWPLEKHVTTLKGFYKVMESVWRLRLNQHFMAATHTEAISVQVKSAAYKHILLQQGIRDKRDDLDVSCIEIYRRMMSDDERAVEKMVLACDEAVADAARRKTVGGTSGGSLEALRDLSDPESVDKGISIEEDMRAGDAKDGLQDDDFGLGENEAAEENSGDDLDDSGDLPEGFVRRERALTMKGPA